MKRNVSRYIRKLKAQKKMQRQLSALIAALSVVVSGAVTWQLRGTGAALNDDSGGDVQQSEDNTMLYETSSVWEKTLPDVNGLSLAESVALTAESQVGYRERQLDLSSGELNAESMRYTRYGDWYGNPYGDWNTLFTYFCLKYGGVNEEAIPYGSGCWAWSLELERKGLVIPAERGSPQRGDVVFIDSDLDGKTDRSGIVADSADKLIIIEGDTDGEVSRTEYRYGDKRITGCVSLAAAAKTEKAPAVPEEDTAPGIPCSREFRGSSASGISVIASADENAFPDGTVMNVLDISSEDILLSAAETLNVDADELQAVAVDITFTDADGSEIEPAPDTTVQVRIILPGELRLRDGELSLLHMDDSGGAEVVENAELSDSGAEFDAESFSMYVLTSSGINMTKSVVLADGNTGTNSQNNPYILYIGEKLEVLYRGYYKDNGRITSFNNNSYLSRAAWGTDNNDFVDETYRRAEFIGSNVGTCRIDMLKTKEWNSNADNIEESFWVRVVDQNYIKTNHDIYVNTALGEKHIDNLHEYLDIHSGKYHDYPEQFILDDDGNPEYIKNGDVRYDFGKYEKNNNDGEDRAFLSYRISNGDTIEVVAYCKPQEKDNLDFSVGSRGSHYDSSALEKIGSTEKVLVTSGEHAGEYRISAKFIGKNPTGNRRSGIQIGNDFFYVVVTDDNDTMSHADIEIDDGGSYVVERYSFDVNGNVTKTVTKYSAAVSDINSCKIFGSNGEQIRFLADNGHVAANKRNEGKPVEFVKDDYYKNGTPGSSQFELTSNYMTSDKDDESMGYGFGDGLLLRGNKNFSLKDSYRADFNVDLALTPISRVVETYDSSGELTSQETVTDLLESETMPGLEFSLGRQAIVDAYNKCPVHTGLDFTLAANAVMVDFEMKKELVGDTMSGGEFTFQLLDGDKVIAEATNGANGIVSFQNVYFNKAGTYNYTVREVKRDKTNVQYADDRPIEIIVSEEGGSLNTTISGITEPVKNYRTYTLPATGGIGTTPYIIIGISIISGAAVLLILSRRKEKS